MKIAANILILVVFLLATPLYLAIKQLGSKRYVTVQTVHQNGAVIINAKKVRVPYTMQQTAIPTQASGILEFLFLGIDNISFFTALTQTIMSALIIFIYYTNTVQTRLYKYRRGALAFLLFAFGAFVLSEICSHAIIKSWIINTQNGINGNAELFGVNTTFPDLVNSSLNLDYQPGLHLFIIPLIALYVLSCNKPQPANEEARV